MSNKDFFWVFIFDVFYLSPIIIIHMGYVTYTELFFKLRQRHFDKSGGAGAPPPTPINKKMQGFMIVGMCYRIKPKLIFKVLEIDSLILDHTSLLKTLVYLSFIALTQGLTDFPVRC